MEAARDPSSPRLHREAASGEFGGAWAEGWQPELNIAGQYHDRPAIRAVEVHRPDVGERRAGRVRAPVEQALAVREP